MRSPLGLLMQVGSLWLLLGLQAGSFWLLLTGSAIRQRFKQTPA